MSSICILPRLQSLGGPTSFQGRFMAGLAARGIHAHHDPDDPHTDALLVIAGTRHLEQLWRFKRRGVRIVQRLDGLNWVHQRRKTGLKHYLRSEWGNWLLATIRRSFADRVVYQSNFVRQWWHTRYGTARSASRVIYNGVDLNIFSPLGPEQPPENHIRLLVVEGQFGGGNDQGLWNALRLAHEIQVLAQRPVELVVAGKAPQSLQQALQKAAEIRLTWTGVLPREDIPALDRTAHAFFSAEINAPCPNAVIEALACGLPVLAFAAGALPELVTDEAGVLAPYGGDTWKLDPAQVRPLAQSALDVLNEQPRFRAGARARAEAAFGLDIMVEQYLNVLLG